MAAGHGVALVGVMRSAFGCLVVLATRWCRAAWVDVDTLARADRNDNPFVQSDLKDELHCQIVQLAGDVTADSQKFLKKAASALHVVTFKNRSRSVTTWRSGWTTRPRSSATGRA